MTTRRLDLVPAWVLHTRPFRETSFIVEFFTQEFGRVAAVARGARGKRGRFKGILQPFVPLVISVTGKGELLTLTAAETSGVMLSLPGQSLLSGLYLNELLVRLLHKDDPHAILFDAYADALTRLSEQDVLPTLRKFELLLLSELGYGLSFEEINEAGWYRYDPLQGFLESHEKYEAAMLGAHLLKLAKFELESREVLQTAKRLVRIALHELLGGKPLKTRELFIKP